MATAGDFGNGGVHRFWTLIWSKFHNMDTSVTDQRLSTAQRCPDYKGGIA